MHNGHFIGIFAADAALAANDTVPALSRACASRLRDADVVVLPAGRGALAFRGAATAGRHAWVSPADGGFAYVDGLLADADPRGRTPSLEPAAVSALAKRVLDDYRRQGPACVEGLYGDFALVVWHPGAPLFCALSPGGARWLYYRTAGGATWLADDPRLLLDTNTPHADRTFFASQAQGCFSGRRTPFDGINRLRPGFAVRADAQGIVETRWWTPPRPAPRHSRTLDGYREELRRALQAAVARHMHRHRRVCIALSGGVDSGAVAACARDVARSTGVELLALTFSTPDDPLADEAPAAREAAARLGIPHRAVTADRPSLDAVLDAAARLPFPTGQIIYSQAWAALASTTREWGATVLLNGAGGELHAGNFEYLLDLHRTRRYLPLLLDVVHWRARGYSLTRMGLDVVARAQTRMQPDGLPSKRQPWLLTPPVQPPADTSVHPMLADLERFLTQEGTGLEMHRALYSRFGVEPAAPHLDRRVIELVLALPLELRVPRLAGSLNKPLLRSAFPEVSDDVCRRADRVNLGEYAARTWIGCAIDAVVPPFLARRVSLVDDVLDRGRLERELVALRQSSEQMGMADVAAAAIWLEAMGRQGLSLN